MCLVLHGPGHITIKLMFEQIWPKIRDGKLVFLECYDFILRSHSSEPLRKLYVLSPHGAGEKTPLFQLKNAVEIEHCNWAVEANPIGETGTWHVEFDGADPYEVTRLQPRIERTGWLIPQPNASQLQVKAQAAFVATGMTIAKLKFENQQQILQYDPKNSGRTTYWLRLAYEPAVNHQTAPIEFGSVEKSTRPLFQIQPCVVLNPSALLSQLGDDLSELTDNENLREGAILAKQEALERRFLCPGTSTRVEDQRINLVTTRDFMVCNTVAEGACSTLGVQDVPRSHALARKWFMGAKHYPTNDPLTLARAVSRYISEWALHYDGAKSKEAVTAALAPEQHPNISHVVEALRQLGLIAEAKGYYYLNETMPDAGLINALAGYGSLDEPAITKACRDLLYGSLPIPGRTAGDRSRFSPKGGRIHYDLVYRTPTV
jgi:hypothetical protein